MTTERSVNMAEFVLSNDYVEFNAWTVQQISRAAIGTKFVPPYTFIYMIWLKSFRKFGKLRIFSKPGISTFVMATIY